MTQRTKRLANNLGFFTCNQDLHFVFFKCTHTRSFFPSHSTIRDGSLPKYGQFFVFLYSHPAQEVFVIIARSLSLWFPLFFSTLIIYHKRQRKSTTILIILHFLFLPPHDTGFLRLPYNFQSAKISYNARCTAEVRYAIHSDLPVFWLAFVVGCCSPSTLLSSGHSL